LRIPNAKPFLPKNAPLAIYITPMSSLKEWWVQKVPLEYEDVLTRYIWKEKYIHVIGISTLWLCYWAFELQERAQLSFGLIYNLFQTELGAFVGIPWNDKNLAKGFIHYSKSTIGVLILFV